MVPIRFAAPRLFLGIALGVGVALGVSVNPGPSAEWRAGAAREIPQWIRDTTRRGLGMESWLGPL